MRWYWIAGMTASCFTRLVYNFARCLEDVIDMLRLAGRIEPVLTAVLALIMEWDTASHPKYQPHTRQSSGRWKTYRSSRH